MTTSDRDRFIPNGIGHFDISGPDIASLSTFYANVFGWNVQSRGPGYSSVETPDGCANGAIVEADDCAFTVGIIVPDLDAAVSAAATSGGTVVMPVTDNGWVKKAQIADPAGNVVTLVKG